MVNKPRIEARDPLQNDGYRFYDNTLEETVDWWPLSDEEVGWFPRSDFISYYSDSSCRSPVLRAEKIGCSAIEPQKYAFDHQFSAEGGWLVSDYGRVVKAFADYSLGADNRQVIATNICPSLLPRLQQKAH